jgi:hypothetical protein
MLSPYTKKGRPEYLSEAMRARKKSEQSPTMSSMDRM